MKPTTQFLKEVTGDLLLSSANAVAHGVAPGDHFDQGLALALRERWPAMAKDFRHFCHSHGAKAGDVWTWTAPTGQRFVSLMTQAPAPSEHAHPGKATVANVRHALQALKKEIQKEGFKSVALPKLATGVGGLSWDEVHPVIVEVLGDAGVPVYLYSKYAPGEKAAEA
jgi:O-acetyl-ADP-ribose deacetylase (regulator of RNase III)